MADSQPHAILMIAMSIGEVGGGGGKNFFSEYRAMTKGITIPGFKVVATTALRLCVIKTKIQLLHEIDLDPITNYHITCTERTNTISLLIVQPWILTLPKCTKCSLLATPICSLH